jgi:hypothetical protein
MKLQWFNNYESPIFVYLKYQSLQWQTVCTTYNLLAPNNAFAAPQDGMLNFLMEHMCQPTMAILVQPQWSFSLELLFFVRVYMIELNPVIYIPMLHRVHLELIPVPKSY